MKIRLLDTLAALAVLVAVASGCGSSTQAQRGGAPAVITSLPQAIPPGGVVWHFPADDLTMMPPGDGDQTSLKLKTAADAIACLDSAHDGTLQTVLCRATTNACTHVHNRLCWVVCWTWATPVPASEVVIGGYRSSSEPQPTSTVMFDKTIGLFDARTGEAIVGWGGWKQ